MTAPLTPDAVREIRDRQAWRLAQHPSCWADVEALLGEVDRLQAAVRRHRDARGHDRCWENDVELYRALPEAPPAGPALPPEGEFLARCRDYYRAQSRAEAAE
jgi:hypothetical protein